MSIKAVAVGVLAVVIFLLGYVFSLGAFVVEMEAQQPDVIAAETNPDRIDVDLRITSVDLIRGDVPVRVTFVPRGRYAGPNGTLAGPLRLETNNSVGRQEIDFPAGRRMTPYDMTVQVYDGLVAEFPVDVHVAWLEVVLLDGPNPVPTEISFEARFPGLRLWAEPEATDPFGFQTDIKIERSLSVQAFSVFVMLTMWAITLGVVFLVLAVVLRGRKIEPAYFGFLGSILFAFPALRNAQPGAPPIGALSDFLAFFWCEAIVAVMLVALLVTWLRRPLPQ